MLCIEMEATVVQQCIQVPAQPQRLLEASQSFPHPPFTVILQSDRGETDARYSELLGEIIR